MPSHLAQMSSCSLSGPFFHLTLYLHLPHNLNQPRWATSTRLGYHFNSAFASTSLTISFSPDELQAVIWPISSPHPSPSPPSPFQPAQMSNKCLSGQYFHSTLHLCWPYHLNKPRWATSHHLGSLFTWLLPYHLIKPRWVISAHLGYLFTLTLHLHHLYHLIQPRQATSTHLGYFSPRSSLPPPLPSQPAQTSNEHLSGLFFHLTLCPYLLYHLIQPRWVLVTCLGSYFHLALCFNLPYHLNQPRRATSACLGYIFTSPFTSTTLAISTSPDKWQALIWAAFSPHPYPIPPFTSLTISSSPDELQALVWAIFFISPFASGSPPLLSHLAQMSNKHSSGLFFTSLFASTSLTISTSPDKWQALVWAIFSPHPSPPPPLSSHPTQTSNECLSVFFIHLTLCHHLVLIAIFYHTRIVFNIGIIFTLLYIWFEKFCWFASHTYYLRFYQICHLHCPPTHE